MSNSEEIDRIKYVRLQKQYQLLKQLKHPYYIKDNEVVIRTDQFALHIKTPLNYPFSEPLYKIQTTKLFNKQRRQTINDEKLKNQQLNLNDGYKQINKKQNNEYYNEHNEKIQINQGDEQSNKLIQFQSLKKLKNDQNKNNNNEFKAISQIFPEWGPYAKIFQVIELLVLRINQRMILEHTLKDNWLFKTTKSITVVFLIAILIRVVVGLGGYSGQQSHTYNNKINFNDKSKVNTIEYGDFQAHRNWMSITINKPIKQWYNENKQNASDVQDMQGRNEGIWWRIDYPPIAAYWSYIVALPWHTIERQSLQLQRGYESQNLRAYMRFSSILCEVVFLFAALYLTVTHQRTDASPFANALLMVVLMHPDLVLIDHGHFQYNSLMLGLSLLAYCCLQRNKTYLCSFFFTLALHTKQMSVYYALSFLCALLANNIKWNKRPQQIIQYSPSVTYYSFIQISKYALIVLTTTFVIYLPFYTSISHVLQAIFPLHRGLYQLKVGNFWCISETVVKWSTYFSNSTLLILCFGCCILASIPSMLMLLLKNHPYNIEEKINNISIINNVNRNESQTIVKLCFLLISLTFFMFSFHVHQKSILLPLLFAPLLLKDKVWGRLMRDLVTAGCTGMYHLLKQDNQQIGYFSLIVIWLFFSFQLEAMQIAEEETNDNVVKKLHHRIYNCKMQQWLFYSLLSAVHFYALFGTPPPHLPYLPHLLCAGFCFALNLYTLLILNSYFITKIKKCLLGQEIKDN